MLATGSGGTRSGRLAAIVVVAALAVALVPATRADALPPDTPIVIDGGGFGHGIGMPQWGAQGMAQQGGHTYGQILNYWYDGTGLAQVSQVTPAVPQTVRVGINYVLVGSERQFRPFLWQDFKPVNGQVSVCKPESQGGDCFTAEPGETWRYRWYNEDGGFCSVTRNGDHANPLYTHPTACDVRLFWADQPNTRVSFPGGDVARTFARGHVEFLGPKTVNQQTGFHLNVVLSLEEYTYGIAEVPNTWHPEALKAQAVAARTFGAWKGRGFRSDCSCNLVWDTWDQAYRGYMTNSGMTEGGSNGHLWKKAVDDTAGQVVVTPAGGTTIARTFYSSSSGGATENVSETWGAKQSDFPYLVSKPDPWSAIYAPSTPTSSTTIRWRYTFTAGQVVDALANGECATGSGPPFPGLTELTDISIIANNASGSPKTIRVAGVANGQATSRDFHALSSSCATRIGTLVSRLGLRSHYIYSFTYAAPEGAGSGQGGGDTADTHIATSVGYHDRSTGVFSLRMPGGSVRTFYFGNPADVPFAGDWTCNGATSLGLYRVSAGFLFLRNTNTQGIADTEIYYGNPGDVPLAGDWNGNGCETVGIYRPSQGRFYLRNSNTQGVADLTVTFGNPGDVPLVGDWNGNGVTTVGVYRPSTRMVYLTNSTNGSTVDITYFYSGAQAGDRVLVGDWDGNGTDTLGVYRPSTGTFYLRNSFTAANADHVFQFGPPDRTPVSGRWGP